MKSATTPTTPEHFKAMLAVLLVNPAKGTVRHARDIPHKHILMGDDAGCLRKTGVMVSAAGYQTTRAKLVWFAATGEVTDRHLIHADSDSFNDSIGNLSQRALPLHIKQYTSGKYYVQMRVGAGVISGPARRTIAEAEADAALMLKVRAAA